jgi:lysophospholipase L1-like esterase
MTRFKIAAFGDSTTAGTPGFKSPIEAPPDGEGDVESQFAYWLMRAHEDWLVLNRGVNRERTDQIRARLAHDVRELDPDVLVIIAGVNDIYHGWGAEAVQCELQTMYELAKTPGGTIPVVAGSILPYNTASADANAKMRKVNDWIRAYAERHRQVTYCDTRAAVARPGDPDRLLSSPDGLHPSPEGYKLMALALEPVIKERLMGTRAREPEGRHDA